MARLKLEDLAARGKVKEPFEIELSDGSVVTLPDPKALPVRTLLKLVELSPDEQMATLLGPESERFLDDPGANAYSLESILDAYIEHYGIPVPGKSNASRGSSRGTARR
jgi:hypothetical protein